MHIGCTSRSRHSRCDGVGVPTHAGDARRGNAGASLCIGSTGSCAFRIGGAGLARCGTVVLQHCRCLTIPRKRRNGIPGSQDWRSSDQDQTAAAVQRAQHIPAAPSVRPSTMACMAPAQPHLHASTHRPNTHTHTPVRAGLTSHSPHDQDRRAHRQAVCSEKMYDRPDIYTMHPSHSHSVFPPPLDLHNYTPSTHRLRSAGCKHGRPRVVQDVETARQYVVASRPAGRTQPLKVGRTAYADDTRRTRIVQGV